MLFQTSSESEVVQDVLLIPVNLHESHWVLVVLDRRDHSVSYFDSRHARVPAGDRVRYDRERGVVCTRLLQYLEGRTAGLCHPFHASQWAIQPQVAVCPQQFNDSDCGVHVCAAGSFLALGVAAFSGLGDPGRVGEFRKYIATTLLTSEFV